MNIGATLAKKVGPMPLAAWLVVGAGGLWIASRRSSAAGEGVAGAPATDALPAGGGYPSQGATGSFDGAPVVLAPIFQLPKQEAPKVDVKITVPAPTVTPTPAPKPSTTPTVPTPGKPAPTVPKPAPKPAPKPTPTVPAKPAPKPASKRTHTIRSGDTLWGLAVTYYRNGTKWSTIYGANKAAIEAAARAHGRSSSSNGHWIYPGTVLVIP